METATAADEGGEGGDGFGVANVTGVGGGVGKPGGETLEGWQAASGEDEMEALSGEIWRRKRSCYDFEDQSCRCRECTK